MCKPSDHGGEFARYLDPSGWLIAFCEDGVVLGKSIVHPNWRVLRRKKTDVSPADWKQRKLDRLAELPWWRKQVRSLPSLKQLERWSYDSVCETVTGDDVEPDGVGPDGAPSWLRALCLI
jgi:hypothetical protein